MRAILGGMVQVAGWVVAGRALLVGPIHDARRAEMAVPAVGSGLFLPGPRLEKAV